ncbi:unnamed protein product, partial [Prorocentrum cordatum]
MSRFHRDGYVEVSGAPAAFATRPAAPRGRGAPPPFDGPARREAGLVGGVASMLGLGGGPGTTSRTLERRAGSPSTGAGCGSYSAGWIEPEGTHQRTMWSYVGEGRGGYEQVCSYNFVGDGVGSYAPETVSTPYGAKPGSRAVCLCLTLAVLLGSLLALWLLHSRAAPEPVADLQVRCFGG